MLSHRSFDLENGVRRFDDVEILQLNDPEVLRATLKKRLAYHLDAVRSILVIDGI